MAQALHREMPRASAVDTIKRFILRFYRSMLAAREQRVEIELKAYRAGLWHPDDRLSVLRKDD